MPGLFNRRAPIQYVYDPQRDISVHQLARLLPVVLDIARRSSLEHRLDGDEWGSRIEELPDDLRRHFAPTRQEVQCC